MEGAEGSDGGNVSWMGKEMGWHLGREGEWVTDWGSAEKQSAWIKGDWGKK